MNRVLMLARVFLMGGFRQGRVLRRSQNGGTGGSWIIAILLFSLVSCLIGMGGMAFGLTLVFEDRLYILALMAGMSASACFLMSIFRAVGLLFSSKDHDMVMSLPVSNFQVILARLLSLYVFNLLSPLIIMLPAIVVYAAVCSPPIFQIILYIPAMLLIPLIPMAGGVFFGWLAVLVSARFRRAKLIGNLLVGLLILTLSFSSIIIQYLIRRFGSEVMLEVARWMSMGYPPTEWLYRGLSGELLFYLLFVVSSAGLLVGLTALMSRRYETIYESFSASPERSGVKGKNVSRSRIMSLFNREVKRFLALPQYILNTGIGGLLVLVGTLLVAFMGPEWLGESMQIPAMAGALERFAPFIVLGGVSMTYTSGCSVSLEGNTLWQLAGLPIDVKEIFISKIMLHLAVAVPPAVISGIILIFSLGLGWQTVLPMILLPAALGLLIALFGLTINLIFPVLDWINEISVIKQSLASMVSIFGGMAIFGLGILLAVLLPLDASLVLWIIMAFYLLAVWGLWRWLRKSGIERFRALLG